jgi:CheY-like chemotaxis protein
MKPRTIAVLVGESSAETQRTMNAAAAMAGADLLHAPTLQGAAEWMDRRPVAAIFDTSRPRNRDMAVELRSRFAAIPLPVIGLAQQVGDLGFEEAYASGMDDLCAADAARLGRRLRHLVEVGPVEPQRSDATVVVADADPTMRVLIGRVFRDAGFQVAFASEPGDALERSRDAAVRAVIISAELDAAPGSDDAVCIRAQREGSKAAFIVNTPPRDIPSVRARIGTAKIAVHDAFASPATLLFVANDLISRPAVDARKSERLLYGTCVRFRAAGRNNEDVGYAYNISEGGLYVRSLALPTRNEEMWLELIPPRHDRFVHLEGSVVWARRFGCSISASVPCGFGIQLSGGSSHDTERYTQSYRAFLAERVAERTSTLAPPPAIP